MNQDLCLETANLKLFLNITYVINAIKALFIKGTDTYEKTMSLQIV